MSLLHMDGFDRYADEADFLSGGYTISSSSWVDFLTSAGRFGGGAVRVKHSSNHYAHRAISPISTIILGASFHVDVSDDNFSEIVAFRGGGSQLFSLRGNVTDGSLHAYVNGSEVASVSGAFSVGSWHRLEIKIVVADAGSFIVEVDQDRKIDFSGDTEPGSGTTINAIRLMNPGQENFDWDDLVIMDEAGSQLNDLIGDTRIYTQAPDSDVAAGWTPSGGGDNHDDVDEVPNDGDTSYVEASAADVRDEYGVADLPTGVDVVHAVKAAAWARKTDANNRSLEVGVGSGASEDLSSGQALSSGYSPADHIVEVDPDGGGAWSPSAVNGLTVIQETA